MRVLGFPGAVSSARVADVPDATWRTPRTSGRGSTHRSRARRPTPAASPGRTPPCPPGGTARRLEGRSRSRASRSWLRLRSPSPHSVVTAPSPCVPTQPPSLWWTRPPRWPRRPARTRQLALPRRSASRSPPGRSSGACRSASPASPTACFRTPSRRRIRPSSRRRSGHSASTARRHARRRGLPRTSGCWVTSEA